MHNPVTETSVEMPAPAETEMLIEVPPQRMHEYNEVAAAVYGVAVEYL